jgi:arginyl-tRNA synthetase
VADSIDPTKIDTKYITSESAYELAKLIYALPQVIIDAGEKYEPSVLTRSIVDLAQSFNRFYHNEHILVDNEEEKLAKLALVKATKIALKNGLSLLGIAAPEKM